MIVGCKASEVRGELLHVRSSACECFLNSGRGLLSLRVRCTLLLNDYYVTVIFLGGVGDGWFAYN